MKSIQNAETFFKPLKTKIKEHKVMYISSKIRKKSLADKNALKRLLIAENLLNLIYRKK